MSEVSLKRFYFTLIYDGLTLKTLKLAFIGFLIQTLQIIFILNNKIVKFFEQEKISTSLLDSNHCSLFYICPAAADKGVPVAF